MKIKCVGRYRNDPKNLRYEPGDVFEADRAMVKFLFMDGEGCFEKYTPPVKRRGKTKQVKAPPVDKAIKEPEQDK